MDPNVDGEDMEKLAEDACLKSRLQQHNDLNQQQQDEGSAEVLEMSPARSRKRMRLSDETHLPQPTPGSRPINIQKQIRMVSLCLNRFLQEPGLVHMVQGYYKGAVMTDVLDRLYAICRKLYGPAQ